MEDLWLQREGFNLERFIKNIIDRESSGSWRMEVKFYTCLDLETSNQCLDYVNIVFISNIYMYK